MVDCERTSKVTETFIVNVGINVSMNERMVDVQLNGPVYDQHVARDRMKYAARTHFRRLQVLQSKCRSHFDQQLVLVR
jgi:hypothetical protein